MLVALHLRSKHGVRIENEDVDNVLLLGELRALHEHHALVLVGLIDLSEKHLEVRLREHKHVSILDGST